MLSISDFLLQSSPLRWPRWRRRRVKGCVQDQWKLNTTQDPCFKVLNIPRFLKGSEIVKGPRMGNCDLHKQTCFTCPPMHRPACVQVATRGEYEPLSFGRSSLDCWVIHSSTWVEGERPFLPCIHSTLPAKDEQSLTSALRENMTFNSSLCRPA